ncbi:hypothetical protein H488_0102590 [Kocuria sp. UCD-OTCP]|nr:hypothetical protein H488_0102590 [Kocuria sp. UCD-OTCP]
MVWESRSGWLAKPVSTTPTVTPLPVAVSHASKARRLVRAHRDGTPGSAAVAATEPMSSGSASSEPGIRAVETSRSGSA